MTINELLGEPDGLDIIIASHIDAILNMAVWPHDVGAVLLHLLTPNRDGGAINALPVCPVPDPKFLPALHRGRSRGIRREVVPQRQADREVKRDADGDNDAGNIGMAKILRGEEFEICRMLPQMFPGTAGRGASKFYIRKLL